MRTPTIGGAACPSAEPVGGGHGPGSVPGLQQDFRLWLGYRASKFAGREGQLWGLSGSEVMAVGGSVVLHPAGPSAKPVMGLRRRPGRLAVAVFRLPLPLYRRGWGGLLGGTFLLLVHCGRKTGKLHLTIAMVLRYDRRTHEAVICSAGAGHRLDPQHPGPPGGAGPDRARVVHTAAAFPVRGGEPGRGGRVPVRAPGEAAL